MVRQIFYSLIKDLMIYISEKLVQFLRSEDIKIKKKALQIVVNDKSFYSTKNTNIYEKFINLIKNNYPKIVQYSTQKEMLSSKESEIWICSSCDVKNETALVRCIGCSTNTYGFSVTQINPETAID